MFVTRFSICSTSSMIDTLCLEENVVAFALHARMDSVTVLSLIRAPGSLQLAGLLDECIGGIVGTHARLHCSRDMETRRRAHVSFPTAQCPLEDGTFMQERMAAAPRDDLPAAASACAINSPRWHTDWLAG